MGPMNEPSPELKVFVATYNSMSRNHFYNSQVGLLTSLLESYGRNKVHILHPIPGEKPSSTRIGQLVEAADLVVAETSQEDRIRNGQIRRALKAGIPVLTFSLEGLASRLASDLRTRQRVGKYQYIAHNLDRVFRQALCDLPDIPNPLSSTILTT